MSFNQPMASIIITESAKRIEFEYRDSARPEYVRPLRVESATGQFFPVWLDLQGNQYG